jgi:hypothetical protein
MKSLVVSSSDCLKSRKFLAHQLQLLKIRERTIRPASACDERMPHCRIHVIKMLRGALAAAAMGS